MSDKAAVGANLYIEDSPENVRKLRADSHPTIVYRNSTNRSLACPRAKSWLEVEDLVKEQLRLWHDAKLDRGQLPGM